MTESSPCPLYKLKYLDLSFLYFYLWYHLNLFKVRFSLLNYLIVISAWGRFVISASCSWIFSHVSDDLCVLIKQWPPCKFCSLLSNFINHSTEFSHVWEAWPCWSMGDAKVQTWTSITITTGWKLEESSIAYNINSHSMHYTASLRKGPWMFFLKDYR